MTSWPVEVHELFLIHRNLWKFGREEVPTRGKAGGPERWNGCLFHRMPNLLLELHGYSKWNQDADTTYREQILLPWVAEQLDVAGIHSQHCRRGCSMAESENPHLRSIEQIPVLVPSDL